MSCSGFEREESYCMVVVEHCQQGSVRRQAPVTARLPTDSGDFPIYAVLWIERDKDSVLSHLLVENAQSRLRSRALNITNTRRLKDQLRGSSSKRYAHHGDRKRSAVRLPVGQVEGLRSIRAQTRQEEAAPLHQDFGRSLVDGLSKELPCAVSVGDEKHRLAVGRPCRSYVAVCVQGQAARRLQPLRTGFEFGNERLTLGVF